MESVRGCQLSCVHCALGQASTALGPADRSRLLLRRIAAPLRRLVGLVAARPPGGSAAQARGHHDAGGAPDRLQPGDRVRVRTRAEIAPLLVDGKTQGLEFLDGMTRYCGTTQRVMKRVQFFFDERAWKMVRCRAVLLEAVICDGRDMGAGEGCDRSCFFYWKDAWLERLEDEVGRGR